MAKRDDSYILWMAIRRALLMVVAAIEDYLGIEKMGKGTRRSK
ncbi:MAG: hypothetical protein ACYSW8_27920 [Planctomycetota bacterium]|jgi:hypothetical protein